MALPIIDICRYLVPFLEIGMIGFRLVNVNPTLLKLIILSWFILAEKYNISKNVMLKNSKCVVNIHCYAPRRMYTHNAHLCFEWYIPSKSPILRELLNGGSGNMNGGFSCIFERLKVWICKIMAYEGWFIINWCMNGFMNGVECLNVFYALGLRLRA